LLRKPFDDKLTPTDGFQQKSISIIKRPQCPASFALLDHRAFQRSQQFFQAAPKHAAILVTRPAEKMTDEQQQLFDRITAQCPEVSDLRQLALGFRAALTADDSTQLRQWIEGSKHCEFGAVVRFAYGLQKDISAVAAAVDTSWSTGQVEGQVNRLKTIKRQMYGRAGFELLRARVLPNPTACSGPFWGRSSREC